MLDIVGRAKTVADLFAGCGTFALPLARKARVHAVEQDAPALAALAASRQTPAPEASHHRNPRPVQAAADPAELNAYDAVVLDPPRAGAEAQAATLAKSRVPAIAYVSCDAASFARDAALLTAGGYRTRPRHPDRPIPLVVAY